MRSAPLLTMKSIVRLIPLLVVLGCSDSMEQPETPDSGLSITVVRGPIAPVAQPGVDNTAPVADAGLAILNAAGVDLFLASTGPDGMARIALGPGQYAVEVRSCPGALGLPSRQPAAVIEGEFTAVRLECDTGIRGPTQTP
jgi:hypothetical protein